MRAIKDLFASERGLFAIVLVTAATVLTGLDRMTIEQWQQFSTYVFGIFVGGKTITTSVGLLKTAGAAASTAPAAATDKPADPPVPDKSVADDKPADGDKTTDDKTTDDKTPTPIVL